MAVTPTGAPVWVRTNDHTTYGGNINKKNYQAQGAVNALTDIDVTEYVRVAADLEAIGRTSPFAILSYINNDNPRGPPTIVNYDSMAGAAPKGVSNANGDVTWSWAGSYLDPYSVSGTIHITAATANINSSAAEFATVELIDSDANGRNDQVRVRAFDDTGTPIIAAGVILVVYTGAV